MRKSTHAIRGWLLVLGALGVVACGPRKPAEDASSAAPDPNAKPDDGTTNVKWEGASAEDRQAHTQGPPAGSQPAVVGGGESRRMDQYDKESTEVVLKRAARQVKDNCGRATDENGKASGPWGKATIQVNLGHNGHSKGATIPEPFEGKPTGRCALQAFSNLTFPPWAGADTMIDWEIEIPPPGK